MGWYDEYPEYEKPMETILHRCGHPEERHIRGRGKAKKEESRNWWAEQNCKACWREEKDEENEEFSKTLPELEGSEKQVNWARTLRINTLKKLDKMEEMSAEVKEKIALIRRVKTAKFWIDTREELDETVLSHVDLKLSSVTTVWYANPVKVHSRHSRGYTYVGGTKPHYTEHELAEVK